LRKGLVKKGLNVRGDQVRSGVARGGNISTLASWEGAAGVPLFGSPVVVTMVATVVVK